MEWDKWPARYLCYALWGQNWGLTIKVTKGQLARARKNVLLLNNIFSFPRGKVYRK